MLHTETPLEPRDELPFDLRRPLINEVDEIDAAPAEADDWDFTSPPPPLTRRARRRRIASKIVGVLAIAGAFYGTGEVATNANARHAMADWLTLGHGTEILRDAEAVVRKVAAAISSR